MEFGGRPVGWFADGISREDRDRLGVVAGESRYQALLEGLAVLIAVRLWAPVWRGRRLGLRARSDSMAALGAVNKQRSNAPGLAAVMRELALDVSEGAYAISILEHVAGSLNIWADALSRLDEPDSNAVVPQELLSVVRCTVPVRDASWWRFPHSEL